MTQNMLSATFTDDRYSFCCGEKNPLNLKMQFHYESEKLFSSVIFPKEYQGFNNVVHGGIIGTVLDEIMVNLHCLKNEKIITAEYNVRLKAPCPVNQKVLLSAWSVKKKGRLYFSASEARLENGILIAEATATCMKIT